jgi:hypothetical protein
MLQPFRNDSISKGVLVKPIIFHNLETDVTPSPSLPKPVGRTAAKGTLQ